MKGQHFVVFLGVCTAPGNYELHAARADAARQAPRPPRLACLLFWSYVVAGKKFPQGGGSGEEIAAVQDLQGGVYIARHLRVFGQDLSASVEMTLDGGLWFLLEACRLGATSPSTCRT